MSAHTFDESANGSTITVAVGEPVTLELEEIPTTGYRWHLDADAGLAVASPEYAPYPTSGIGGGGVRRFVVTPQRPGDLRVRAGLWREWEGEGSTIKRFALTLQAR